MFSEKQARKSKNYKIFTWLLLLLLPVLNITYANLSKAEEGKNGLIEKRAETLHDGGLRIKSVDTQIISKHWGKVGKNNIQDQVELIKGLNANFVAVSTPYDNPELLKEWANEIHKAGMSVWFRSHWLSWEGDENHPSDMTIKEYLDKTSSFIKANPVLFKSGDAFTVCVEPEQVFTARGTDVYDWYSYNKFIVDQIDVANEAFADIGYSGEIHTNWISMNGWVVENALEEETVEKMEVITVDHYPNQKVILPSDIAAKNLADDLDRIYAKWKKPIILGEWGYNIEQEVSDLDQEEVIRDTLAVLSEKSYLIGLNYWSHMGNNSRLISDKEGTSLILRPAAKHLRDFYQDRGE